jgi:putative Ca2+/H+ antiporter (TMEM165/GDT1 family)
LGSAAALVVTSGIAVVVGEVLARHVSPFWVQRGAGIAFLAMGVLLLAGATR